MEYTKEHVEKYLESKQNAWAKTTLKTAQAKFSTLLPLMQSGPASCHASLKSLGYGAYTVKQYMILASGLASANGDSSYGAFITDHAQAFKNAYVTKKPSIDFDTALERLSTLTNDVDRDFALTLLRTGLRISEPASFENGSVIGKGNKRRAVGAGLARDISKRPSGSISEFRRRLKSLGLRPHDLRKLFATKAIELGAREADLCRLMGWSSIATAASYVQATRADEIAKKIGEM